MVAVGPIVVKISGGEEKAEVSVRDHGLGGNGEKDFSRIFERFERVLSVSHINGIGLGLYITKQIVEAHFGIDLGRKRDESRFSVHGEPAAILRGAESGPMGSAGSVAELLIFFFRRSGCGFALTRRRFLVGLGFVRSRRQLEVLADPKTPARRR